MASKEAKPNCLLLLYCLEVENCAQIGINVADCRRLGVPQIPATGIQNDAACQYSYRPAPPATGESNRG
ncbi:unnamed protein product [Dovyalis caffra]|uniref:Uncharacterized protein n=1 Tax=Dovyalis caffra TaxID=77055 RepID=A0AAV1RWP1_9ROSI|nr:unnamed protein product [Dovyalis caffra]